MKYIRQFLLILAFSLVGELLHFLIPLPVPASIYGLLLLLAGLCTGLIHLDWVKDTGLFLVEIMPVMFIPAAVGLLESWPSLQALLVPALVITLLVTVATMAAAGRTTQALLDSGKKKGGDH